MTLCQVTDEHLKLLGESCRDLRYLRLDGCPITHKGIKSLMKGCRELAQLFLGSCPNVLDLTDIDLSRVETLSMTHCDLHNQLTSTRLRSLRELFLDSNPNLDIESLQVLSRDCSRLRILSLSQCSIDDEELEALKIPSLESLDLGMAKVTDSGLQSLIVSSPSLTNLSLRQCERITGDIVKEMLQTLPLVRLNVLQTPLRVSEYKRLLQTFPNVQILYD